MADEETKDKMPATPKPDSSRVVDERDVASGREAGQRTEQEMQGGNKKSAKNLYLSDEAIEKLKKVGGSASGGVEKLLAATGKAGGKVVKAMTPSGEVVKKMPEDVSRTAKGTAKVVGDVAAWQQKYAAAQTKLNASRAALYRARGGKGRQGLVNPQTQQQVQTQQMSYPIQPPGIMGQGNVYAYYEQLHGRNPMLQAINPFNAGGSFSMGQGYSPLAAKMGQGVNVLSPRGGMPSPSGLLPKTGGTSNPFGTHSSAKPGRNFLLPQTSTPRGRTPRSTPSGLNPFGIKHSVNNVFGIRRR